MKNGIFFIEAYYTLSFKALSLQGFSNRKSKSMRVNSSEESCSFVLVGQLAKHISLDYVCPLSIEDIWELVNVNLQEINEFIPVRLVLIECSDEVKEKKIYEKINFSLTNYSREDETDVLNKYILKY